MISDKELAEKVKEKWGNNINKPGAIEWKLKLSMSFTDKHSLLYRSKYRGREIQMEVHTPKRKNGEFGKGKRYFFIDNDKRTFDTQAELIAALGGDTLDTKD